MYVRRAIAIAIASFCLHDLAFAQEGGSTTLHDFDDIGDSSSIRTEQAEFKLVDGGRDDRGKALRATFDPVPESKGAPPALVFEETSMRVRDFSEIGALSFWVKNESDDRRCYISIAAQDLDGKRSWTSPDRVYVSRGAWHKVVYRLDLQGLDRKRIGSLHVFRKSTGPALTLLFDDFNLLSPMATRLNSLEEDIRLNTKYALQSATQIGLRSFVENDTERLTQRIRAASSLVDSERLSVLSQLARDAKDLVKTIQYRPERPNWGPEQATGPPNTAIAGDIATAWNAKEEDTGPEWLKLTYGQAVDVAQVRIHETFNPGAVTSVTAATEVGEVVIWSQNPVAAKAPNWLELTSTTAARTDTITIHLDTSLRKGWNQIDAVELVGTDGTRQWAENAESSTVFPQNGAGARLTLRGPQVTDAWLAQCAPKIAHAQQISLDGTSITDVGLAQLSSLEHLVNLELGSPGITGLGLKGLVSPKLKRVELKNSAINDAGLAFIAPLTQLESINLRNTGVTDVGLRHLAGMKRLKGLDLFGTAITDNGLSHLRDLSALEFLHLGSTDVTTVSELVKLKKLSSLILTETSVNDVGLTELGAFPELEMLFLSKTDVRGPGLAGLSNAQKLSYLDLNGTRVNDAALAALAKLPKLTRLEVSGTRITDATLDRFGSAGRLKYLDIYGTNVSADGIRRLGGLKELAELYVGGTAADDDSIAALSEIKGLFHLDLQGTRITDRSLESIAKFRKLKSLNLSGTAIKGSTISKLKGIEELRTLNLANTQTADEALDTIARVLVRPVNAETGAGGGFARLNRLILNDTEVSDAGLKNISRLKHLFALHLDRTKVSDRGLEQIALLPDLSHLRLDGTAVTDKGLVALTNLHQLNTLSLKRTRITDEALSRIGDPIRKLELSHTRVTNSGMKQLAGKAELRELELAGTTISDGGLELIARLPNLRKLDLAATAISNRAMATLKTLPALEELSLDRTTVTDQAAETLANFEKLGKVSLNGTRVTADGKALLARRHPELNVSLDYPWVDAIWTDGKSVNEWPWSFSTLPEESTVADLGRLSTIRSLSLQHRTVNTETLVALQKLSQLESLDLADTNLDDDLIANLNDLPRLRVLRLSHTAISDDGLRHLAGLQALEHLDLAGTMITGAGLGHLTGLISLRSINLSETLLRDEHAAHLAKLRSLRRVSATNTRLGDVGLRELEGLSALRYLDLYGTDVSDVGLESIGGISSLSHLYLTSNAVTDNGLGALAGLEELVELGIDHTRITDLGLEHVTDLRHLERLRLNGTHVSDAGVKAISEIPSLQVLELNGTAISDHSVADLLKIKALKTIGLNGTRLSDRGLAELANLATLERLSIRETRVSPSGVEAFRSQRPEVALTFASEPARFSWIGVALSMLYGLIAVTICLYGAHRYLLVWLFVRDRKVRTTRAPSTTYKVLPRVTIQIPLFNERNVAERVITAACAVDYPRDRLQIQVLDDSTDDCTKIVRESCDRFKAEGVDIVCHHRESRHGFKSGALAAGLESATGELVAIFDADFVPAPDFLNRTVHYFTDERVGVVQAEWRHLNRDESSLTQCQAMFLDAHLMVEQAVRARTGRWFNFNGTAGLWRRSCIDQSGGWRHDTLTEDTDLSYRAQLDGWRFVFLPNVLAEAELPSNMSAFLGQQHRWTRGLLQCAVKLMGPILFSKAPMRVKAEAWFHLTSPILYTVMFVLTVLAIPATFVVMPLSQLRGASAWALGTAVLLGGTLAAAVFVLIAQRAAGQSVWRTLIRLPSLMALGVGMSAVNTHAALGALLGTRSTFVRTPKFGGRSDSEVDPDARRGLPGPPVGSVELVISGLLLACLVLGLSNEFALIGAPFLLLFAAGFLWVGGARFVDSERREAVSVTARFSPMRWSGAAAIAAVAMIAVLRADSILRAPPKNAVASRVVGLDLTHAEWQLRGSGVAETNARRSGLTLDVDLDPEAGGSEEGELFIDLSGPLAPIGASLTDSQKVVFDIAYPDDFSGELQAFVSDAEGKSQYGSIRFVERHDTNRRVQIGIAPGALTPAMGFTDSDFDLRRPMSRVGLKVSAQSDRVRGRGYRPFRGQLTVADVRVIPRGDSVQPEIRSVSDDDIYRPQPTSEEDFLASSGADRPWPLGYAFSGPLSAAQRKTLEQTYAALNQNGLGFTRVYLGDYRTGLSFDRDGSVTGVEPQFLDYLDELTEIANGHEVTVMFSLMDNTILDGKGVEFPQFVVDRKESARFVAKVLAPMVEKLAERRVIWDLFNEPENVTGTELGVVQDFVDRALTVLRKSDADAKFTVVSRSAHELIYWRGRGLDILSHNVFDERGLDSAMSLASTTKLDAPVWIAEMDPDLATAPNLEALRRAGYRGVGLWGWGTGDKYDWNADELERIVCPLIPATVCASSAEHHSTESAARTRE